MAKNEEIALKQRLLDLLKDNKISEPHPDPQRLNIVVYKGFKRVSSIELYSKNKYSKRNYDRFAWIITSKGIAGEEFLVKPIRGKCGRPRKEYLLSLSFAREICFFSNTVEGMILRKFIKEEENTSI